MTTYHGSVPATPVVDANIGDVATHHRVAADRRAAADEDRARAAHDRHLTEDRAHQQPEA